MMPHLSNANRLSLGDETYATLATQIAEAATALAQAIGLGGAPELVAASARNLAAAAQSLCTGLSMSRRRASAETIDPIVLDIGLREAADALALGLRASTEVRS